MNDQDMFQKIQLHFQTHLSKATYALPLIFTQQDK